jgi:hypothetical protein
MSQPTPLSEDSPELRLIAKQAGIDPVRLARALADPTHLLTHISAKEMKRLGDAVARISPGRSPAQRAAVLAMAPRIVAAIDAAITHKNPKEQPPNA